MVIIIAVYKIVDGYCVIPTIRILEKHSNSHDFGFDIDSPKLWLKYLIKKGYHKLKSDDCNKLGFKIHTWGGGTVLNLFPGTHPDGSSKRIGQYGILTELVKGKLGVIKK